MSPEGLPSALAELIAAAPMTPLRKRETLVQPGAVLDRLWWVESGLLRSYALSADGGEFNHDFLGAGAFACGSLQWVENQVCCAEAALGLEALQPSRVRSLLLADLQRLRQADAACSDYLFALLMQSNARRMSRASAFAQASAEQRYVDLLASHPQLPKLVSQKQIAAWLGITPVALSRIRGRRA